MSDGRSFLHRDRGALTLDEPPVGPLRCDGCQRFVSVKDAHITSEYGDYGQHYSSEVWCPACDHRGGPNA